MTKKHKVTKKQLNAFDKKVAQFRDTGMTIKEVMSHMSASKYAVQQAVKRNKLKNKITLSKDYQEIVDLIKHGYSVKQTAKQTSKSETTVRRAMKSAGVKVVKTKEQVSEINQKEVKLDKVVEPTRDINDPIQYLITPATITLIRDNEIVNVSKDHVNFDAIDSALVNEHYHLVFDLIDIENTLLSMSSARIDVDSNGETTFYLDDTKEGFNIDSLESIAAVINFMRNGNVEKAKETLKFTDRLMDNPSNDVVKRIYDFCSKNDVVIDSEGYIICYKKVDSNFMDIYTGTIDNSVGKIVEVMRNQVDERSYETCSFGLHVCSASYLNFYGTRSSSKVIRVRVDPRDIVAIPADYDDAKVRCCKYEVIADVTEQYMDGMLD